ncbi:hypothetical protein J6590_104909 [Homalodisca vitripennis]|nr:hypothetical protein J6590_104909 [Homalodisca vitripennis]
MDEARAFATSFGSVNMMSFTLKPRIGRGGCFPQTAFSLLHTRDIGVVRLIEEVNFFHEFRRHLLNMRRVLALARRNRARFSSVGDLLNIRKAFLRSRSDILHSSVHQGTFLLFMIPVVFGILFRAALEMATVILLTAESISTDVETSGACKSCLNLPQSALSSTHLGLWGTLPGISRTLVVTGAWSLPKRSEETDQSKRSNTDQEPALGQTCKLVSRRSIKQDSDHQGPWKPCCPLESK